MSSVSPLWNRVVVGSLKAAICAVAALIFFQGMHDLRDKKERRARLKTAQRKICRLSNNLLDMQALQKCPWVSNHEHFSTFSYTLRNLRRVADPAWEQELARCFKQNLTNENENEYEALLFLADNPYLMQIIPFSVFKNVFLRDASAWENPDIFRYRNRAGTRFDMWLLLCDRYLRVHESPWHWNNFEILYATSSASSFCYWDWAILFSSLPSNQRVKLWEKVRRKKSAEVCATALKPFLCRDIIEHVVLPYLN